MGLAHHPISYIALVLKALGWALVRFSREWIISRALNGSKSSL